MSGIESTWVSQISSDGDRYQLSEKAKHLTYGTAGYRDKGDILETIAYRIGAITALRSLHEGKAMGIMVTASHNPPADNGLKVIDPAGEMLPTFLEKAFSKAVQASNFAEHLQELAVEWNVCPGVNTGAVLIGGDTRDTTPILMAAASEGVTAVLGNKGCAMDFGVVTTPQLHMLVAYWNSNSLNTLAVTTYYDQLCAAFQQLTTFWPPVKQNTALAKPLLHVDCAHGVGTMALSELSERLAPYITLRVFNGVDSESDRNLLNRNCGADFVKIHSEIPHFSTNEDIYAHSQAHWCSLDGDADRIIYWIPSKDPQTRSVQLLDGDRIACLFTKYLQECLSQLPPLEPPLVLGMVCTAYTNAAATQYMRDKLGVQVDCVKTGVKYLHPRAAQYDIGVYFEANGHGTILFSERAKKYIATLSKEESPLPSVMNLINQCCGDAISDVLLTEHILWMWQFSLASTDSTLSLWWHLYTDWPSRQLKVQVPDRYAVRTNDDETRVIHPKELQESIDAAVNEEMQTTGKHARAFVRPSGTEDIIRVYAESITEERADKLAKEVSEIIQRLLVS